MDTDPLLPSPTPDPRPERPTVEDSLLEQPAQTLRHPGRVSHVHGCGLEVVAGPGHGPALVDSLFADRLMPGIDENDAFRLVGLAVHEHLIDIVPAWSVGAPKALPFRVENDRAAVLVDHDVGDQKMARRLCQRFPLVLQPHPIRP